MSEQELLVESEKKAVDVVRVVMGVGGLAALVIGLLIVFNPLESGTIMMKILAIVLGSYLVIAGLVVVLKEIALLILTLGYIFYGIGRHLNQARKRRLAALGKTV